MRSAGIAEDSITYNTLLAAASTAFGSPDLKEESLRIGLAAFDALERNESCQPSSLTYSYLFKLIRRLVPKELADGKERLVKRVFDSCCRSGCLNDIILQQVMKNTVDSHKDASQLLGHEYSSLLLSEGVDNLTIGHLPKEWSRRALSPTKRSQFAR
jgi:hypothetical protein